MSSRPTELTPRLHDYLLATSLREPDVLRRLREETARHPRANMQISPEQGQLMRLLVQLIGAKRTLEVGVFTGYSSISVALGLPPEGRIVACDVSVEYTNIARRYWKEAGVQHKIDLRLAPATQTLDALLKDGQEGSFDFAFIDADKENYEAYYERALELIRRGGVIGIDNVLWYGRVADPGVADKDDAETAALRALNAKIQKDERVFPSLLPMGDGLTLALKL
jgi:caffeoyl-CoA O-methyltransferase